MDLSRSMNSLLTSIYNFMEEMHEAGGLEAFTFTYSLGSNLDVPSVGLYIKSLKKLQKDFKDSLKSIRDYSSIISTTNFSEQGIDPSVIVTDATNNNINPSCTVITNAVINNNDLLFESNIQNVTLDNNQSLHSQTNLINNDNNLMLKDTDISCTSNNLVIPFSKLNIDVSSENFSNVNRVNPGENNNKTLSSPNSTAYISDLVLSNTESYSLSSSSSMPLQIESTGFPTIPSADGFRGRKKSNCRDTEGKLKRHLTPDADEIRFRTCDQIAFLCCKVCCLACLTITEYDCHICRVNSKEQEISKENIILRSSELQNWKKFICSICHVEFRTYSRILYHLPRCFPGPYNCNSCSMSFTTQKSLDYHKKKIHLGEKCFMCEECGRTFERKTSLRKHCVYRHELDLLSTNSFSIGCSSQDHFQCDTCNKKFIKKIFLTHHKLRMHGLDKRFLCPTCGNKFMTKNSLLTHMEIHDEEKKFTCTHCMKTFRRKEKLVHHTRIHTGERPFQCSKCKKSFVSKTRLNEHISRHNGARRYCCPDCPKSYAAAWDLKKHVQKKHNKDIESVPVMVIPNINASISCQDQTLEPYLFNNKETLSTITPPVVSHHKMQHRLTVSESFSGPSVSAVERPSISSSAISYSLQNTMESMHLTDNDIMTNTML